MKEIGRHKNIINLIGACTQHGKGWPIYFLSIVFDYYLLVNLIQTKDVHGNTLTTLTSLAFFSFRIPSSSEQTQNFQTQNFSGAMHLWIHLWSLIYQTSTQPLPFARFLLPTCTHTCWVRNVSVTATLCCVRKRLRNVYLQAWNWYFRSFVCRCRVCTSRQPSAVLERKKTFWVPVQQIELFCRLPHDKGFCVFCFPNSKRDGIPWNKKGTVS